ncbi:rRNA maturation RNase YbeY [Pedobacter heparinus]|uniref:rRNA maturation RNase YbeY n=1 Tax=Pedobacter heparinus TaxID=984 RepID=UPI002931E6F8|nr:rRNA maturation RNase YbeY [Pedobacter heparinus]
MAKANIHFFTEDTNYSLKKKTLIKDWIKSAIIEEGYRLQELNFILCSDEYLLRMNQDYLQHDTYTDVITFDNSEELKTIIGDVFISIERIQENAQGLNLPVANELHRVMIHGTLHLLGYKDKGKAAKSKMTSREDHYLAKLS